MEKKIFKGFYHIWAWWPSWSTDCDHFSNLSFPHPKEAPYEIWAKLAQRLQRSFENVNWPTDAQKVITIAHPEQSSGELKRTTYNFKVNSPGDNYSFLLDWSAPECLLTYLRGRDTWWIFHHFHKGRPLSWLAVCLPCWNVVWKERICSLPMGANSFLV